MAAVKSQTVECELGRVHGGRQEKNEGGLVRWWEMQRYLVTGEWKAGEDGG